VISNVTSSLTYDSVGNVMGPLGNCTYDALNRPTAISYPDTTSATYGYDVLSRLTTAANPTGTLTVAYDNRSRVNSVTDVFGQGCKRLLMISSGSRDDGNSKSPPPGVKSILINAAVMSLISAILGSILGLTFCVASGCHELLSAAAIGFVFGGWVGLVVGLLFRSIRSLRELQNRSWTRMILVFTLLAGIAGAVLFFPCSEGPAMALYLVLEGAVAGGLIGALLAIILRVRAMTYRSRS
jgi:YD repeat-containing protein